MKVYGRFSCGSSFAPDIFLVLSDGFRDKAIWCCKIWTPCVLSKYFIY